MDTLNERLARFAELQKKNLAPLNGVGDTAFAAFERIARKNHELMGDMVEYAVAQSRGSLEQRSPQALYEQQLAEAKAFAERMGARAAEYAALAEAMRPDDFIVGTHAAGGTPSAAHAAKDGNASVVPSKPVDGKAIGKKAVGRKVASKEVTAKKAGGKKAAGKKATGRKATAKKATAKKAAGKKAAGKKASGKKSVSKKPLDKKSSGKTSASKAPSSKRAASKTAAGKKASAGKRSARPRSTS